MAFGITPDGFELKPLETILQEINDFQLANVDPGLDQDPRDPLQQINSVHAAALSELWELAQAAYSAAYPDSASGASLDNVASITGTTRSATTKTLVEDVNVTMGPNKVLPAGSVAHLANQPNARFLSLVEVPANPAGGVFQVDFEAETGGATAVAALQLNTIAEPVSGWSIVSNPTAGETGSNTETDSLLRVKRITELEGGGSTNVNSIRANLSQDVPGVVDAAVLENDTDVVVAGLAPHSIRCILRGGTAALIAQSIFDTKAAGIATNGAQLEAVLDSQGISHDIRFDFASQLDYYLTAVVDVDPLKFDTTNGVANMEIAVAAYVNALNVGGDVIEDQVICALLSVLGVIRVSSLDHGFAPAPSGGGDLVVAIDEFAVSDVANIGLTTNP